MINEIPPMRPDIGASLPPRPRPHHPPTDIEPAFVIHPWEECCPTPNECACVTEEDVENWNKAVAIISAYPPSAISSLSALDSLNLSAILWNKWYSEGYKNVNPDSATEEKYHWTQWDDAYSALSSNSSNWNDAYSALSSTSSIWNDSHSALTASADIWNDAANKLENELHFDVVNTSSYNATMTGDGTSGSPYGVRDFFIKMGAYPSSESDLTPYCLPHSIYVATPDMQTDNKG